MESLDEEEDRARILITAMLEHFGYEIANGPQPEPDHNAILIIDKLTHMIVTMFWLEDGAPLFLNAVERLSHQNTLIGNISYPWLFYDTLDDLDIQLALMGIHP